MRWTRLIPALAAAAALAGCASSAPSAVLAAGPRMIDLFRGVPPAREGEVRPGDGASDPETRCRWWLFSWPCEAPVAPEPDSHDAPAYTRTAANELELLFPRLPNPDIYIHVLPHLATEARVPVPGYTTAVPVYERVEYALAGELEHATRMLAPGSGQGGSAAPACAGPDGTAGEESGEGP